MDADEREIYLFLKPSVKEFTSAKEICRRAGGKHRYREDQEWAKPIINRMVERGILETDGCSHYRIKPPPQKNTMQRWVSPQIARILQNSGKDYGTIVISDADLDNYYESL